MHGLSGLRLGAVRLTVHDLERSRRFYEGVVGLRGRVEPDGSVSLHAGGAALAPGDDGRALVELHGDRSAPPLDPSRPGLFHLAILVPSRRHLAEALMRLVARGWSLDGASDHLVSEALYLSDPDGNGIEIYHDRPREQWPRDASGRIQMATLPLDLQDLAGELRGETEQHPGHLDRATRLGHVHLQVGDLAGAEAFYAGLIGLDVTVRGYPGALFVSADGYHHHLGLNTWRSRGAAPPAPGAVGLREYEILLPEPAQVVAVRDRLLQGGAAVEEREGGIAVRDAGGITTSISHA